MIGHLKGIWELKQEKLGTGKVFPTLANALGFFLFFSYIQHFLASGVCMCSSLCLESSFSREHGWLTVLKDDFFREAFPGILAGTAPGDMGYLLSLLNASSRRCSPCFVHSDLFIICLSSYNISSMRAFVHTWMSIPVSSIEVCLRKSIVNN